MIISLSQRVWRRAACAVSPFVSCSSVRLLPDVGSVACDRRSLVVLSPLLVHTRSHTCTLKWKHSHVDMRTHACTFTPTSIHTWIHAHTSSPPPTNLQMCSSAASSRPSFLALGGPLCPSYDCSHLVNECLQAKANQQFWHAAEVAVVTCLLTTSLTNWFHVWQTH